MKKVILLAATQLVGAIEVKGVHTEHVVDTGAEVTPEDLKKLGIDDKQLHAMLERGTLVEGAPRAAADVGDVVDEGITLDEFHLFLSRNGFTFEPDASIDDLLELVAAPAADTLTAAQISAVLTDGGVQHDPNAAPSDMVKAAIAHGQIADIEAAATKIERDMKVEEIKAELGKLTVPFETDANKPALAKLLAQVRATSAPATLV